MRLNEFLNTMTEKQRTQLRYLLNLRGDEIISDIGHVLFGEPAEDVEVNIFLKNALTSKEMGQLMYLIHSLGSERIIEQLNTAIIGNNSNLRPEQTEMLQYLIMNSSTHFNSAFMVLSLGMSFGEVIALTNVEPGEATFNDIRAYRLTTMSGDATYQVDKDTMNAYISYYVDSAIDTYQESVQLTVWLGSTFDITLTPIQGTKLLDWNPRLTPNSHGHVYPLSNVSQQYQ